MKRLSKALTAALFLALVSNSALAAENGVFGFFKKDSDAKNETAAQASNKPVRKKSVTPPPAPAAAAATQQPAQPAPPADPAAANKTALLNRMANNRSLNEADKNELVATALQQFPAGADLQAKDFEKQMLRFEQIVNDPNMSAQDKKSEIQQGLAAPQAEAVPAPSAVPAQSAQALPAKPAMAAFEQVEVQPVKIQATKPPKQVLPEIKPETVKEEAVKEEKKAKKSTSNFAKKS